MMEQLTIEDAIAARDAGISRAMNHAESKSPGWSDLALAFTRSWCLSRSGIFTAEDISDAYASREDLIQPAQTKAWGSVVRRAITAGYMKVVDHNGRRRKGHCSPCPRY